MAQATVSVQAGRVPAVNASRVARQHPLILEIVARDQLSQSVAFSGPVGLVFGPRWRHRLGHHHGDDGGDDPLPEQTNEGQ